MHGSTTIRGEGGRRVIPLPKTAVAAVVARCLFWGLLVIAGAAGAGAAQPMAGSVEGAPGGPSITISLADRRLYLTDPNGSTRGFPIAVGRPGVPIPVGVSSILRKRRDPTWRPTAHQRREKPSLPRAVPPGPNNPLGKFALDLGWTAIAIHGTNEPESIGKQASGGCFRMLPADIEAVFAATEIGTPVRVVRERLAEAVPERPVPVAVRSPAPAFASLQPVPPAPVARVPTSVVAPPEPVLQPPPTPVADPRCATVTAPLRRMICDVPALALLDGRARGVQERFLAAVDDPAARAAASYELIQDERRFHERIAALCWIRSGTEGEPAVAAAAQSCLTTALDRRLKDVAERIADLRGGARLAGRP
ncbi:L,D-transpeptidase family protein [Azospirillum sp. YIM B02556]|uniref:L,D-transpeptidase family protein n=1 Tax=Azospirillum endophyticum TaxID=2800326 RepID=A0ABS1F0S3_9PROT|nr:L,D-transpeptidase family protein [Azospirillum endophyticum]MBK1837015.1 L,D-transpeptidase family protein [Azospirillum endophyticum]